MTPLIRSLFAAFSLLGIGVGLFLFMNPSSAIEIQRKFYEMINWRIEPISMEKEIRSTKFMGLFVAIIASLIMMCVCMGGL